ncbi:MAG: protein kinase [Gammaproteobacteria bacterium]
MTLLPGARLGPYEILALLGVGGMGEVYRARDTKLGRDVALKVLLDAVASDPERIARFSREAQVLASLNHPNIGGIYGLEDANGVTGLVLELVEGPTLADRIAHGAIPLAEAIPIARQIADALVAAHEQGIIHRDLKPANINVRNDGTVKVLDFGLAKALGPASAVGGSGAGSPTITTPAMTQMGVILGTAAYMSPEQAKGRGADKRSDVWAFGCVLYEMLTGRRAFQGEDVSDTLASVLKSDPDWNALPSTLPGSIRSLIEGSLKKDRRERIGDVSTALFVLNHPQAGSTAAPVSQPSPQALWRRAVFFVVGVAIGVAAATGVWKLKPSPAVPVTRFAFTLPQGQQVTLQRQALAIAPDGTRIAYAADGRLYLRAMSELEARAIPETDGAVAPVFSPDGQSLVFFSVPDSALKRIAVSGGVPTKICQSQVPTGMSWGSDGILFAVPGQGIMRVSPNGGNPEMLVAMNGSEGYVNDPQILPGDGALLFTVAPGAAAAGGDQWANARTLVQSLKTGERKTLIEGGADARYVPTGHLVYVRGGTLFALPFNLATLTVTGGAVSVVEGVRRVTAGTAGTAHFAFSNSGSLAYLPGPASGPQQALFLFDRKGGMDTLNLPPGSYGYPRVSPDGTRLAFETTDRKGTAVSIYELSGASSVRRLTFDSNNRFPIWSADGHRITFQSDREGDHGLFWQSVDGGAAQRLTKPDPGTSHVPESWSPAGETLLFSATKGLATSLWTLSVPDRKTLRFDDIQSSGTPTDAAFSPDGRWVAYQTAEPGETEGTTYVQSFPPSGTKHEIARGGRPLWSRDGKELFYIPSPTQFMAVTVRTEPNWSVAGPVAVPRGFGASSPATPRTFDILPDGRFVGIGTVGQDRNGSGPAQIQVVLNWFEELKVRVPTK